MANTVITPTIIAQEALMQLENNLVLSKLVYREFRDEFVKVGATVNIRKPVRFTVTSGATASIQDVSEANTSIVVNQQKHVDFQFTTADKSLTIEKFSERYIQPAMIALAQDVDSAIAGLYSSVWQHVGTVGTTPATYAAITAAAQRLDESAVPFMKRNICLNPAALYAVSNDTKTYFSDRKATAAVEAARLGLFANLETYMTQSIVTHTVGPLGGSPLVNGASQSVTYPVAGAAYSQTFITDGWTAAAAQRVAIGDVLTFPTVFSVNPVTKQSTARLQEFVITSTSTLNSDGAGNLTVTISPPLIISGPYQTVTNAPADNAAITIKTGTTGQQSQQNLAFHPNAFALVTVPMELPDGAAYKARQTGKGLSVRIVGDYDYTNDTDRYRIDILYGVKAVYPELAVRLTG